MGRTSVGELFLQEFVSKYKDVTGDDFMVNYGMIIMANRMAKFYSKAQVRKALEVFFDGQLKKDFYHFVDNLDTLVQEYDKKIASEREFEALKKKTTKTVKQIHKKRVGRKT